MPKGTGSAIRQAERDAFRAQVQSSNQAQTAAPAKAPTSAATPNAPAGQPAPGNQPATPASQSAPAESTADVPTPLAFDDAVLEELTDILPALAPLIKTLAEDCIPATFKAKETAQTIFDRCLSSHRPCTSQEARSKQEATVSRLKAAVAAMGDDDSTETLALKSKLKAEEATLKS